MQYWYFGVICVILAVVLEILEDREKIVEGVICKTAASALFVLTGFLCAKLGPGTAFSKWIVIGLCLGFAGDVVLHVRHLFHESMILFAVGTLLFAAGHVCYIIAIIPLIHGMVGSALLGAVLLSGTALYVIFSMTKPKDKKMAAAAGVYLTFVGVFTAMALELCVRGLMTGAFMLAAGAVLFLISDSTLIYGLFAKKGARKCRWILMITYYAAQSLIALCLQFIG